MLTPLIAALVAQVAPPSLPAPAVITARALAEAGELEHAGRVLHLPARRGPSHAQRVLEAIDDGLAGRANVALPAAFLAALDAVPESDPHYPANRVLDLVLRIRGGDAEAQSNARGFLRYDVEHLRPLRLRLLRAFADLAAPNMREPLVILARDSGDPAVRTASLLALTRYNDPEVSGRVLSFLPGSQEQTAGAELLTRRAMWAKELVRAVGEGAVEYDAVLPEHVERMRRFEDPDLDLLLAAVWGNPPQDDRAAAELRRVSGLWNDLEADGFAASEDELRYGARAFAASCARCHAGGRLGPETRALARADLTVEIVEPAGYEAPADHGAGRGAGGAWELVTADGLRVSGVLVADRLSRWTLEDTLGNRITLPRDPTVVATQTSLSAMPPGLTRTMTDGEVRGLLAWLRDQAADER